jgi:hypothetical protein
MALKLGVLLSTVHPSGIYRAYQEAVAFYIRVTDTITMTGGPRGAKGYKHKSNSNYRREELLGFPGRRQVTRRMTSRSLASTGRLARLTSANTIAEIPRYAPGGTWKKWNTEDKLAVHPHNEGLWGWPRGTRGVTLANRLTVAGVTKGEAWGVEPSLTCWP